MKKAIITGATGLVGLYVARYLSAMRISVLCLGRQSLSKTAAIELFGDKISYLQLPMEDINSLEAQLNKIKWSPEGDCVFFHFAWQGDKRLTDGNFSAQLINASYAANAVRTAKKIGCVKFINAGTLEETYIERHLKSAVNTIYQSQQSDYALAKLASRDLCKMVAYMEKIDYVHTRMSIPLAPDLSVGSYVAKTLKLISEKRAYTPPQNKALFDIISTEDVAHAYYLIGKFGLNTADYFIGTAHPATLAEYFDYFARHSHGEGKCTPENKHQDELKIFSIETLQRDTGFVPAVQFENIVQLQWTP